MTVAVLGAGAFGTALAITLAQNGPVQLWGRRPEQMAAMQRTGENQDHLPGIKLPQNVSLNTCLKNVFSVQTILLCVPMQQLAHFLDTYVPINTTAHLVACCKGVDIEMGRGPSDVLRQHAPDAQIGVLTGPSFASDIAKGLPTALTLACADDTVGTALQQQLSTPTLRLYRTTDVKGAELGGALKNVVAIACGAAIGAGLGESARAAVMTRGFAEMSLFAQHLGASSATLAGLSGFGDLVLTCTSAQSRNYRLGFALGAGKDFDPKITVEGATTAQAVYQMTQDMDIDMPIIETVAQVLAGSVDFETAMTRLLARPLKEE